MTFLKAVGTIVGRVLLGALTAVFFISAFIGFVWLINRMGDWFSAHHVFSFLFGWADHVALKSVAKWIGLSVLWFAGVCMLYDLGKSTWETLISMKCAFQRAFHAARNAR